VKEEAGLRRTIGGNDILLLQVFWMGRSKRREGEGGGRKVKMREGNWLNYGRGGGQPIGPKRLFWPIEEDEGDMYKV
jgi:hypothetical protein